MLLCETPAHEHGDPRRVQQQADRIRACFHRIANNEIILLVAIGIRVLACLFFLYVECIMMAPGQRNFTHRWGHILLHGSYIRLQIHPHSALYVRFVPYADQWVMDSQMRSGIPNAFATPFQRVA